MKKARRAPRGRGTVFYSQKRSRWVGRAVVGRTAKGRTLYVERVGRTQAEVIAKLKVAETPGPETTVAAFATRWLDSLAVRPSTKDDYAHTVGRFVAPSLGHLRVRDVTAGHVEQAAKDWSGRGLGPNTLRKSLAHLRIMLNAARRSGLVAANPVSLAAKPKPKKVDINPFAPGELARIIRAATEHPPGLVVALLAGVGCRVGEAIALDVTDFDPKTGRVTISKTFSTLYGSGKPKSDNSTRTVRVPVAVLPALRAAAGDRKSGPLFLSAEGNRRSHNRVGQAYRVVLRRAGVGYRNLHQLRHSVATAMISNGVPLGDVAVYLGDTVETIVKTYLHPAGTDPADTLDRLLGGGKVAARRNRPRP